MMVIACPSCGTRFRAAEAAVGKKARCPRCRTVFELPLMRSSRAKHGHDHDDEDEGSMSILPARHDRDEDLIDMTAMVDVVFFLLIFFLVTSLTSVQAVMDMPTPQSANPGATSVQTVASDAETEGIVVRIEDDDSYWIDDVKIISEQQLRAQLHELNDDPANPLALTVQGSADASHGAAVRAMDAGAGARVSSIRLQIMEDLDGE